MAQRFGVTRGERTKMPEVASVLLSVPAHKDYIAVVRSSVAQLGVCFGFTLPEIGDLRLAVDEACNLLVQGAAVDPAADTLQCRAVVAGDRLRVTVAAPVGTAAEPPDTAGFGWVILTALVDTLAWEQDTVLARVELEKRRAVRGG